MESPKLTAWTAVQSSLPPLLSEENKEDNIIDGVVASLLLLMVQDIFCLVLRPSQIA